MNRNTSNAKARDAATTRPASLYEVIYMNTSLHRAPSLPKHTAGIAYVRQIGTERRYLVPHSGRWIEVNEEMALQRAEGLRRLRASNHALTTEQSVV